MWPPSRPEHGPVAGDITRLLRQMEAGDASASERLMATLYDEVRRIARGYLGREGRGHALQTTELVHEAYLRLLGGEPPPLRETALANIRTPSGGTEIDVLALHQALERLGARRKDSALALSRPWRRPVVMSRPLAQETSAPVRPRDTTILIAAAARRGAHWQPTPPSRILTR